MTSIHEVAKSAGVSASTVSRVINGTKYVSPQIRDRVLKAIDELNFQPSTAARNLRLQQTQIVGVLLPSLEDYFFGSLAFVIEKTLLANHYRPLFCSTENSQHKEADYLTMLTGQRVDGILMVPSSTDPETTENIRVLMSRQTPVVLLDNGIPDLDISQVIPANRQGGYEATRHLVELGHRHIGVVTPGAHRLPPHTGGGYERLLGMYDALTEYGIPQEPIIVVEDFRYIESGLKGTRILLEQNPQVTAIFAITDQVAIGVLRALCDMGLKSPDDISVIGYGNIPLSAHLIPRLTTIIQPIEIMGKTAVEVLLRQMQNPAAPYERIRVDTQLVIRESTALPAK